jgi:spore coat protein U-like protein
VVEIILTGTGRGNEGEEIMKKRLAVFIALSVLAAGGAAWAADFTTVAVSANVVGTCKFNNTGSISFTLDPADGSDVSGVIVQPTFWCTRNAAYTITDDLGEHELGTVFRMQHTTNPAEFIPYSFTYTAAGIGNGPTNLLTMNIASTVLGTSYTSAAAGDYTDTVRLDINP